MMPARSWDTAPTMTLMETHHEMSPNISLATTVVLLKNLSGHEGSQRSGRRQSSPTLCQRTSFELQKRSMGD
jgi:hypothetical protein